MDERRTLRVSEAVREELSEIIGFEAEDPRLLAVEVIDVHVSADGAARQRQGGAPRRPNASSSSPWPPSSTPRHSCGTNWPPGCSLRHVPELHFDQDRNPDVESRIDFLLKRAKKSRGRDEN